MITKLLEYFSENRMTFISALNLKYKMEPFLNLIRSTILKDQNCPINDIFILATIFSKHLSVPNFLFDILVDRMGQVELN